MGQATSAGGVQTLLDQGGGVQTLLEGQDFTTLILDQAGSFMVEVGTGGGEASCRAGPPDL